MLNTYQVNYNDENTLELYSELWYKYAIQLFKLFYYSKQGKSFLQNLEEGTGNKDVLNKSEIIYKISKKFNK